MSRIAKQIENDTQLEPDVSLKVTTIVLLVITSLCFIIWFAILSPFLAVLAWSLTLTIITLPVHEWLEKRVSNTTVCASLSVIFMALAIAVPSTLLFRELILSGSENAQVLTKELETNGGLENLVHKSLPRGIVIWIERNMGLRQSLKDLTGRIATEAPNILGSSIWILIQVILVLFTSFFLLRDKELFVKKLGNYLPLSKPEYRSLFSDVRDTIQATVFGNIVTSCIQGALGGFMFWVLGLPAPVLWGAAMAFLSLLPTLGSPVIWVPAAIYLASQGDYQGAIFLILWGTFVIGLIDNILYPILVGQRVRLHTLAVFFFIFGGILFFGTSGLVLGPMALAIGQSLLKIWRARLSE